MKMISKEKITSIILNYFNEKKGWTPYRLKKQIGVEQKTVRKWMQETDRSFMRKSSFDLVNEKLGNEICTLYVEFREYFIDKIEKTEADTEGIVEILRNNEPENAEEVDVLINKILEQNNHAQPKMQEILGRSNIINSLEELLMQYKEYFQIAEKSNVENMINDDGLFKETIEELGDFLIVKFPGRYSIGILLANYEIDYTVEKEKDAFCYRVEKFKNQNDLQMVLLITDLDKEEIPIPFQGLLMKKFNLFFECIGKNDLEKVVIQGLQLKEDKSSEIKMKINQHRYAQLIFDKFMSYLTVVSNEIVFSQYLKKLDKKLDTDEEKNYHVLNGLFVSYNKRTNIKNFMNYANGVLINDIFKYSYLSRHTIYYERNLVEQRVKEILKERNEEKMGLVVEICAPNSLITCNIIDECKKLVLFTASYSGYSLMNEIDEKTGKRFIPGNVFLHLSHLNPEYMGLHYLNELKGKVDLLVIGFGGGSQISDLVRFIRYANGWLSDEGVLFLSVHNAEAIMLNRKQLRDQRFESYPMYMADYWTYTNSDRLSLLKKMKTYSIDDLKAAYLSGLDIQNMKISTYPYISTLINPEEYPRNILDEIREEDKLLAEKGTHGQLIQIFAQKNIKYHIERKNENIKKYLNSLDMKYEYYTHTLAPDSKSLMNSLRAEDVDLSSMVLLKTVILQSRNSKDSSESNWVYAILPYDKEVVFDQTKYELVPEKSI